MNYSKGKIKWFGDKENELRKKKKYVYSETCFVKYKVLFLKLKY